MRKVLGNVGWDVIVLAMKVESDSDLKWVDNSEPWASVGTGRWGDVVCVCQLLAWVVEEESSDEGSQIGSEQEVIDLMLHIVQLIANLIQLIIIYLPAVVEFGGQLAGLW